MVLTNEKAQKLFKDNFACGWVTKNPYWSGSRRLLECEKNCKNSDKKRCKCCDPKNGQNCTGYDDCMGHCLTREELLAQSKDYAKKPKGGYIGMFNMRESEWGHSNLDVLVLSPTGKILHRMGGHWPLRDLIPEIEDVLKVIDYKNVDFNSDDQVANLKERLTKFHQEHMLDSLLAQKKQVEQKKLAEDSYKSLFNYHKNTHKWAMNRLLQDYKEFVKEREKFIEESRKSKEEQKCPSDKKCDEFKE